MTRPPRLDDSAITAALGGRVPVTLDRAGRVKLLGEFAEAGLAGRDPSRESVLFVAGAIRAWLERGGNLERDFLRVVKPKSHQTPAAIWQQIRSHQDERQGPGTGDSIAPSSSKSERRK